jgi:CHC2 zinc finger
MHRTIPPRSSGGTSAAASGQSRPRASAPAPAGRLDGSPESGGHNPRKIDFAYLKRGVSLSNVLEYYGLLEQFERQGSQVVGPCPLHSGSNPKQFVLHLASGNWFCFGDCNRGGTVLDFVALRENVPIVRAAQLMAEWFGIFPSPQPKVFSKQRSNAMNARPSHRAYVVEDPDGDQPEQKGFWTRIGSAWPHKDGKGLNIQPWRSRELTRVCSPKWIR